MATLFLMRSSAADAAFEYFIWLSVPQPFPVYFFRNISKNAKKLKFLGPSQHPQFFYLVSYFYFFPRVGTGPGAALQWVPPAPRVAAGTGPQGRGEAGGAALQPKVVQE